MAIDWVDISGADKLEWGTVLETLAECIRRHIKPEVTGARVYPYWVYEIDIASMLGKVTAAMQADAGTSQGGVHCWTLGISNAVYVRSQNGSAPEVSGGQNTQWTWDLTVDVWGFWSYGGKRSEQNLALNESRLVSAALFRNALKMVEAVPLLSDVQPLEFTALQPTPFSEGKLISVASGAMHVRVKEALGI